MEKTYECLHCSKICIMHRAKVNKYCSNQCQKDYEFYKSVESGTASHRVIKRYLIEKNGSKCFECGISDWNGLSLVMELEHIDGNSENNSLANVKLLCPNCHSQTPTYKAKNVGNGRHSRRIRYQSGKSY